MAKSFGKVLPAKNSGLAGVPCDPHRFRAMFPDRWAAFLRAHHRSVEEVAVFYDVTFRTATYWWEGMHRPSGDKVALAATSNPAGFQAHFGRAA